MWDGAEIQKEIQDCVVSETADGNQKLSHHVINLPTISHLLIASFTSHHSTPTRSQRDTEVTYFTSESSSIHHIGAAIKVFKKKTPTSYCHRYLVPINLTVSLSEQYCTSPLNATLSLQSVPLHNMPIYLLLMTCKYSLIHVPNQRWNGNDKAMCYILNTPRTLNHIQCLYMYSVLWNMML